MSVHVELDGEQVEKAASFIVDAMNQGQHAGFTIDEMLCAALYMIGAGIKQRGAILHLDKPLREALPPIALGYETAEHAKAWQIEAMQGH